VGSQILPSLAAGVTTTKVPEMRAVIWLLSTLIAGHGLLHLLGFAKAFGLAELPALSLPVTRPVGVAWLLAGVLTMATAVLMPLHVRHWWIAALVSAVASQLLISGAWTDAKYGTIVNVVVAAAGVFGLWSQGPMGLHAEYRAAVQRHLALPAAARPPIGQRDLARLPAPVQCYLQATGALDRPPPRHFTARWRGRIRGAAEDPWMAFTAEQHNFFDPPARLFFMRARRGGLPVDVFHAFVDGAATMRVRLLSMVTLVDASGPELTKAETVTLLNDAVIMAPAALLDPAFAWDAIDSSHARVRYSLGDHTVGADLEFNAACELVNFVSDDRSIASADGSTFTPQRWSTPLRQYETIASHRVATVAEGRWHPPAGDFAYLELELLDLQIDDRATSPSP
jgi:hypothetical protein